MIGSDLRRYKRVWDLEGPNVDNQAILANALFKFLVDEQLLEVADEETQAVIDNLRNKVLELEEEYELNPSKKLETQISQLQEQLSEYDNFSDVYDLEPDVDLYYDNISMFEVEKLESKYAIGDESEFEDATKENLREYFDEYGIDDLDDSFITDNIDADDVAYYIESYYEDSIYESPEDYLDESDRNLSQSQKERYQVFKNRYDSLEQRTFDLAKAREVEKNEDRKDQIMEVIRNIEGVMDGLLEKMDEITENPEGDFPDDKIQEKIDEIVEVARKYPINALDNLGVGYKQFVDMDGLIDDVIRHDGYTSISNYDGNVDEVYFNGETYLVVRID